MLKRVVWTFMHTNKLHPGIALSQADKHPLNFMSQEVIKKLVASDLPVMNKDKVNLEKLKDRMTIHEQHFKSGAQEAYKVVLSDFCLHADFIATSYCTPKLSFSLNFLNFRMRNIGVEMPRRFIEQTPLSITTTILGQWVEMEETRSNDKILGLWDVDHIKSEISAGIIGPEASVINNDEDSMTYIPIKQTIRLSYEVEYESHDSLGSSYKRIDVFDWERSLSCPVEKEEWTIANINSILI
jgi:hypothetical protein